MVQHLLSKSIALTVLVCLPVLSLGQEKFDAERIYYSGEFATANNRYEEALGYYLQLLEHGYDNPDIQFKVGYNYYKIQGQRTLAIPYLEKAIEETSLARYRYESSFKEHRAPIEAHLFLGEVYQILYEFDMAASQYEVYRDLLMSKNRDLTLVDHKIRSIDIAKEKIARPIDMDSRLVDLPRGQGVSQSHPVLSMDGQTMVFMSDREYYTAIYMTRKLLGGWTKPKNITMELQSDGNYRVTSLSPDGSQMFLSHFNDTDYELYTSYFVDGRWTGVTPLDRTINTLDNEVHAALDPSLEKLYIVSDRNGGWGGFDIYVCRKNDDGSWTSPENLGPIINTPYNENTPFFDDDGTLYFSSEGHETMGGYDIFICQPADTGWTSPYNIGYPVNSTDHDLFFVPVKQEFLGFSSAFNTEPGLYQSIVEYEFYSDLNPRRILVEGDMIIPAEYRNRGNEIRIDVLGMDGQPIHENLIPNNQGAFSFEVPPGTYQVSIGGDLVEPSSEQIKISESDHSIRIQPGWIALDRPGEDATHGFLADRLYFAFDSHILTEKARTKLDTLATILNALPEVDLIIYGHTDAIGRSAYNQRLSEKRAQTAMTYLASKGIIPNRMRITGKGEADPLAPNTAPDGSDNPDGRAYNRRVEFEFQGPGSESVKIKELVIPPNPK